MEIIHNSYEYYYVTNNIKMCTIPFTI
jgi:hypothetical protein